MNTTQTSYRDFVPVLQFVFKHGLKIEQFETDMWRIRSSNTVSGNQIDGLDISKTYPSFDLAVQAIVTAVGNRTSAAA